MIKEPTASDIKCQFFTFKSLYSSLLLGDKVWHYHKGALW